MCQSWEVFTVGQAAGVLLGTRPPGWIALAELVQPILLLRGGHVRRYRDAVEKEPVGVSGLDSDLVGIRQGRIGRGDQGRDDDHGEAVDQSHLVTHGGG